MAFNFDKAIQSGMTEQSIRSYLEPKGRAGEADAYFTKGAKAPTATPSQPGFIDRAKESLGKRVNTIASEVQNVFPGQDAVGIMENTIKNIASPSQGDFRKKLASLFVRTTGELGAGVGDVIGAGIETGVQKVPEDVRSAVSDGARNLFPTQIENAAISALQKGAQGWAQYKTQNPDKAKDLEGIAKTILGVADVVGAGEVATGVGQLAKTGARGLGEGVASQAARDVTQEAATAGARQVGPLEGVAREAGDFFSRTKQRLEENAKNFATKQQRLGAMSPVEAEAVRSGIDEGTINVIKTASPENQKMFKKLTGVVKAGVDNPRAAEQAESIIGRTIAERGVTPALEKRDVIGKQIGDVIKRLPKEKIDITPQVQQFEDALKSVGYTVEKGELKGGTTAIQGDKGAYQDMYNRIRSGAASPEELHKIRQAIFKEFNLAKARNQTFSADADRIAEQFRRIIAEPITAIDNTYLPLSEQYAKTMDGLSKFLKFMGYTGDVEKASAKTLNFGERARGLIGRRANRPQEVLDSLFEITNDAGAESTKDIQDLVRFADYLEGVYGSPKTGTFRGQVGSGVQDALREGFTGGPVAGLKSAFGKLAGPSAGEQQRALENLLESIAPDEVPLMRGGGDTGPKGSGAPTPKTGVDFDGVDLDLILKTDGQPLDKIDKNTPTIEMKLSNFKSGSTSMDKSIPGVIIFDQKPPVVYKYWLNEIKNGARPPVLVGMKGKDGLRVVDGNHRMNAYTELGIKDIPVIYTKNAKKYFPEMFSGPKGEGAIPKTTSKKIVDYVKEFFRLKRGDRVINPQEKVLLTNSSQISRQSLKHVVESRVGEGMSMADINKLINRAPEVIKNPEIDIPNPKQQKYPGSSLLGRFYPEEKKAVMVILDKDQEIRDVISIHYKNKSSFYDLLSK